MNVLQIIQKYKNELREIYQEGELNQVIFFVFEQVKKFSKTDMVLKNAESISADEEKIFESMLAQLKNNKPVQYVLGHAWFYGLQFHVNENVLIPRQETEELVDWILKNRKSEAIEECRILDICTGSGCIAVSLKKNLPDAKVSALDISEKALAVARENAQFNHAKVEFIQVDILSDHMQFSDQVKYNIIVSNPPYIHESEKKSMKKKELDYEPHLAFFVADQDPLIFYKRIAAFALQNLEEGGRLYFEINELKGAEVVELLKLSGFSEVTLRKDLNGKDRMVMAVNESKKQ